MNDYEVVHIVTLYDSLPAFVLVMDFCQTSKTAGDFFFPLLCLCFSICDPTALLAHAKGIYKGKIVGCDLQVPGTLVEFETYVLSFGINRNESITFYIY